MKSQISRNSLQADKRYSGVYQQQGRMITDADWNELADLEKQRLWDALKDAIKGGAPRESGLAILADKTIQPGILYADGLRATLPGQVPIAFTNQPDYPQAPALPAGNFRLYADIWDRTVTSLEDAHLVDPGLHGADTCTRTQTQLQVKWCPNSLDPMNAAQNPAIGDGEMKLKLRQIFSGADPCDPCATEIDVDERIGNYLFRVEVHDRYAQGSDQILVLKWSRDNGAEQFNTGEAPIDFKQGAWAYEFFDGVTEKNLGLHWETGFAPKRGKLVDDFTVPTDPADPKTWVRQWDGYAVINLSASTLIKGRDKGVALSAGLSADAHGFVSVGADLHVNFDLLEMDLSLAGRAFVPGDYWHGVVREAAVPADNFVLGSVSQGKPPHGPRHHYLKLADVNGAGAIVSQTDEEKRRFHFPPLSDIRAADVGFTEHCATLFNGAKNVQEALDALCTLAADDIAYTLPGCPAPSVAALMAGSPNWADIDGDGKVTVKDMLDALLCRLNAARLPYDGAAQGARWSAIKSEAASTAPPVTVQNALDDLVQYLDSKDIPHTVNPCGTSAAPTVRSLLGPAAATASVAQILDLLLCNFNADHLPLVKPLPSCTDLNSPSVLTVQDALETLCQRAGAGGCETTVGVGGQYGTLKEALAAFSVAGAPVDMILCLLPGDHILADNAALTGKRSVKIMGSGVKASVIRFQGLQWGIQAAEIHFEDVAVVFSQALGSLILECPDISLEDAEFTRIGASPVTQAMIQIAPTGNAAGKVFLQNNTLNSTWQRIKSGTTVGDLAPVATVGDKISLGFARLLDADIVQSEALLDQTLNALAKDIVALPSTTRKNWKTKAPKDTSASERLVVNATNNSTKVSDAQFYANIDKANLTEIQVRAELQDLVFAVWETGFNPALSLASVKIEGRLAHNTLDGDMLILHNGTATGLDIGKKDVLQVVGSVTPVNTLGGQLDLIHNRLSRLTALAPTSVFDLDDNGRLKSAITGYAVLNLDHNTFTDDESAFIAGTVNLQGNRYLAKTGIHAATILATQFLATGNSSESGISLRHHSSSQALAANLVTFTVLT